MKIRLPASDDYLELTPGDQAAFLLGGAVGFAGDLVFTLGLSGGAGAMAGASAGVGLKRAAEAAFRRGGSGMEKETGELREILEREGLTQLATRLDRYEMLLREGLLTEAEFRARLGQIMDAYAAGEGKDAPHA